jgi:signal transduction histidine kinase
LQARRSVAMNPSLRSHAVELAWLAVLIAGFWLPASIGVPLGAVALVLWIRSLDSRRERRAGAALFGAALLCAGLAAALGGFPGGPGRPLQPEALTAAYRSWLGNLREDARAVAAEAARLPAGQDAVRAAFDLLERRSGARGPERTYLLLDADGEAVAWSGRGLLQELAPERLQPSGFDFRQSATSATLLALQPVGGAHEGWRLIAGESRSRTGAAPLLGSVPTSGGSWYLTPGTPDEGPRLAWLELPHQARSRVPEGFWRIARLLLALGLLVVAALRAAGRALLAGTVVPRRHPAPTILVLAAAALPVAAWAAGAGFRATLALAGAGLLAGVGWWVGREARGGLWILALGAGAAPAVTGIAQRAAAQVGSLTGSLGGSVDDIALRVALVLGVFALVAAGGAAARSRGTEGWAWAAAALAVLGAATADVPVLALTLLVLAGTAAARSVKRAGLVSVPALGATFLLAAMVAGGAWVCGDRWARRDGATAKASTLLPPSRAELDALEGRIEESLAAGGIEVTLSTRVPRTETGDLAYAIWRDSALARFDALSALVVEAPGQPASSFSFGLPLDGRGMLDLSPARWVDLAAACWSAHRIQGEREIDSPDGTAWHLRWWLVPRLGFGSGAAAAGDLAAGLVRGSWELKRPYGLAPDARWAVWDGDGTLRGSAWEEGTPRPSELPAGPDSLAAARGRIATPEGPADVGWVRTPDARAAVFVPRLSYGVALERAGIVAAGALLPLALLAVIALVAALPRSAVRDLARRALRSYSKRLLIVFAALLLLPSALLYVFLSRTLERRIEREQEQAARTALRSVERVLGEYVLTLEPGFGIGTAIDDPLLEWLSRVAQHEVNLYWGSEVYASSKRDLFAAGLLPRRLPGEVWVHLRLDGDALARRTTRAGDAEYLELYAPLEVPGQTTREARLVLSMPLLAQQEEAIAEAAILRRRALLATLGLFLVLTAIGIRLGRRFTRPIEEIVAGTRRIAAGAPELGFRPEEVELEALAVAIDRMAGRIAQARDHLVAEKRLVERIVDSVTAGVIAVDAAGSVLIANRAGRALLGVEPGQALGERLAASEELAPVAAFLAGAAAAPGAQTAVRLNRGDGDPEREWTLVRVPLPDAGDAAALIVIEDVTEVLRAQRLDAWAAMARIIAHEIKNPLTPIRLSAEHLREAWTRDRDHFEAVFERCTENILRQVEELREIASEFSTYSQIPRIDRQEGDLAATVAEVVAAYGTASPGGLEFVFSAQPDSIPSRFDARLLSRAVRNLIENAVRAAAGRGRIEIRVEAHAGRASVSVSDQGPGVPPDLLPRILEPYFSTHSSGTGLGLPIAARIAEEHGGSLTARNRPSGGFEVIVTIPVT